MISDEAVEAAAEAFGYITGTRSRYAAEAILQAAAPHLVAQVAKEILEGMRAWAGDKELGFLEGYSDASDDAVTRAAGAGE